MKLKNFFDSIGVDFGFDAESYRGAAGWLIFVASTALLYHIAMIIVRILYMASVIDKYLTTYGVVVSGHDYTDFLVVIYNSMNAWLAMYVAI